MFKKKKVGKNSCFVVSLFSDVPQGNNPKNVIELLQFRLAQHGLRILDVGGAGDCFFTAVSHQLYGEPSYQTNVRSTGVEYIMRNNPEGFIESSSQTIHG